MTKSDEQLYGMQKQSMIMGKGVTPKKGDVLC